MYNDDGTPRFDELVTAKILFKFKEAVKANAKEKYADEIKGNAKTDLTPEPTPNTQAGDGNTHTQSKATSPFKRSSSRGGSRSSGSSRSSGGSSGIQGLIPSTMTAAVTPSAGAATRSAFANSQRRAAASAYTPTFATVANNSVRNKSIAINSSMRKMSAFSRA